MDVDTIQFLWRELGEGEVATCCYRANTKELTVGRMENLLGIGLRADKQDLRKKLCYE